MKGATKLCILVFATFLGLATPVAAQDVDSEITQDIFFGPVLQTNIPFQVDRGRNVSVTQRDRPEFDPIGLPVSTFTLYPKLASGIGYSTNVSGATVNPQDDVYFAVDPSVRLESNWSRHALVLQGGAQLRRYATATRRDQDGLYASLSGRYDIVDQSNVIGLVSIRRAYEEQYSGSFPANAIAPIQYTDISGLVRGQYQAGRFRFTLAGDATNLRYGDSVTASNIFVDQTYRDRTVYRVSGRTEYAFLTDAALFGQFTVGRSDYDHHLSGRDYNRDGQELQLLTGATADIAALLRATAGIGYIERQFDSPTFKKLSGFAYDVRVEYFPSELTTVTIAATRSVEDAISTTASGYFSNNFRLRADHELLRNLLLFVEGDYQSNTFADITRRDSLYQITGGGRYLSNRWLVLGSRLSYLRRKSDGQEAGQTFNEFRAVVSATFQY